MVHLSAALTNVPKSVHDANPIIVQVSAFFDQSFEFLVVFERIRKKAPPLILLSACAGMLKETGMQNFGAAPSCGDGRRSGRDIVPLAMSARNSANWERSVCVLPWTRYCAWTMIRAERN